MRPLALIITLLFTAQLSAQEFSHGTIQIGMVVKDMNKSLAFYKDIVGMQEMGGFPINEDFGKRSGLSNGVPFEVKILKLVNDKSATQLKLVTFEKDPSHATPSFIQDDNGVQYMTIYVKSAEPVLKRIKENNLPLLGDTPTKLGDGRAFILIQDPDGTFVEIIEGE